MACPSAGMRTRRYSLPSVGTSRLAPRNGRKSVLCNGGILALTGLASRRSAVSLPRWYRRGDATIISRGDNGATLLVVPLKGVSASYLELEAKPYRGIDRVAIKVTVSHSVIDLREHEPGVGVKLCRKPPIDGE